ncbi:MAG: metalloregulator ArsR/SmtB family transcription factor [Actinomycetota bacterium]
MSSATAEDQLSLTFSALANPTRRAILARLARGSAGVNELAEPFDLSLPAISRHIRVLERAGLVVQSRQAQYRPCRLDPRPLDAVSAWTDGCREAWEAAFDRLDDHLRDLQANPKEEDDE